MKINRKTLMEEITKNVKILKGIVYIKVGKYEFIFNKFENTTLYIIYNGDKEKDMTSLFSYLTKSMGEYVNMDDNNIFSKGVIKILEFVEEINIDKLVKVLEKIEKNGKK